MKRYFFKPVSTLCLLCLLLPWQVKSQGNSETAILDSADLQFLEGLTMAVLESSRIYPGQKAIEAFGPNNTGGTLIRPGGRNAYPSFWIRDYAMSLESGLVQPSEQKHMLLLTASTQCDQTWITQGGSMVPYGAVADHVRIDDGLPIFYPGTYSYEQQGIAKFGKTPPYSDQFFFIHMAWYYITSTGEADILSQLINGRTLLDRLQTAFHILPEGENGLVYTTDDFRGVDFGFRDVQVITGYLCYPSILKYRAAGQLAELLERSGRSQMAGTYRAIAEKIKKAIPEVFMTEEGMLRASTGKGKQKDVWSTALAVYLDAMSRDHQNKAGQALALAYRAGTLSYKGNIRHILTTDDFNEETAWEISLADKNTYQNGAYWGTPTGWVCYAIAQVNIDAARRLAKEYIDDLRETDYRKGDAFGGPYECFHPETDDLRNPVYLTTVASPFAAFKKSINPNRSITDRNPAASFADQWEYVGIAVQEPGYTIWGTSPVLGEDGKVHLFVARWPCELKVDPGWRTHSEIAHYVGDSPEGPFVFSDVAIKEPIEVEEEKTPGGKGRNAYAPHNPTIHKVDSGYALFYIANDGIKEHPSNQYICLAVSKNLYGPWRKAGDSGVILSPPENQRFWNFKAGNGVNNPAFLHHPDGGFFLYFKSEKGRMGLAIAEQLEGPYVQLPFPITANERTIEDGYAFRYNGKFALITTDNHGMIEAGGGILWTSEDGIHFDHYEKGFHRINAYTKLDMDNVAVHYGPKDRKYAKFERPQMLLKEGKPWYLYAASGTNIYGGACTVSYVLKWKNSLK